MHIDEAYLSPEGKIDVKKTEPIARLGYYDYTVVREVFEMKVPGTSAKMLGGLEGSAKVNRQLAREVSGQVDGGDEEGKEMKEPSGN